MISPLTNVTMVMKLVCRYLSEDVAFDVSNLHSRGSSFVRTMVVMISSLTLSFCHALVFEQWFECCHDLVFDILVALSVVTTVV